MNEQELINEICELESGQGDVYTHIRTKVLTEGKKLRELQKWQKQQQKDAKERGEEPETWKAYVKRQKESSGLFPAEADCRRYMRISQYPGAYEKGMSVKEAYKMATAWKKNGGNPPPKTKVSIQNRLPARIGAACGRFQKVLEKWNEQDWDQVIAEEKWSNDELIGLEEAMREARQDLNQSIRKFNSALANKGIEIK